MLAVSHAPGGREPGTALLEPDPSPGITSAQREILPSSLNTQGSPTQTPWGNSALRSSFRGWGLGKCLETHIAGTDTDSLMNHVHAGDNHTHFPRSLEA